MEEIPLIAKTSDWTSAYVNMRLGLWYTQLIGSPVEINTKKLEFEAGLEVGGYTFHLYIWCGIAKYNFRMAVFHLMLIGSLDKGVHLCWNAWAPPCWTCRNSLNSPYLWRVTHHLVWIQHLSAHIKSFEHECAEMTLHMAFSSSRGNN